MNQKQVISVQNVYKSYPQNRYRISLRHDLIRLVRQRILWQQHTSQQKEVFWALQNINFSVNAGEAVAIIGRNGSGKTTLFRLLCGITSATAGTVEIDGKFVALIALGAGFHYERTGRENIYLSCAMHGVHPSQAEAMLSDIIDFSEIQAFIDTPVKHYSSGMLARLAFSTVIHLLPDIIFIDEILAVGDAAFQQKCIHRILELKQEKRTLLLVSHIVSHITMLCERTIWLHQGQQIMDGATADVLSAYQQYTEPIK